MERQIKILKQQKRIILKRARILLSTSIVFLLSTIILSIALTTALTKEPVKIVSQNGTIEKTETGYIINSQPNVVDVELVPVLPPAITK